MIAAMSPLARRIVAVALLLVSAMALLALAGIVIDAAGGALDRLAAAREERARLEALRDRPSTPDSPPVPAGFFFPGPSHEAGAAAAVARLYEAAAAAEIGAEARHEPQDSLNPQLIRISLAVEGEEGAVLGFVGEIERGSPPVRLRSWRIERVEGPTTRLRLEGIGLAAWRGGS